MDGGRIFRAILARKTGFLKATVIAARLTRWFALIMVVLAFFYSLWFLVLAVFLLVVSLAEQAAALARFASGDPGYQDLRYKQPSRLDPFKIFVESTGFKVPGTDWEVLDDEDTNHPKY